MSNDEIQLLKLIKTVQAKIKGLYFGGIEDAVKTARLIRDKVFNLDDYPNAKAEINKIVADLADNIHILTVNSIGAAWRLSDTKNDLLEAEFLKEISLERNEKALEAFITRSKAGLTLSQRIWNTVEPFKHELEAGLAIGIKNGESAATMATRLKVNLNDPDKLFRRVRDENGKLQLSKAARRYHPGQGVYRSSYKNALRLTGTEINISYRTEDSLRWQSMEFVTGVEVKTSNNHPTFDECDALAGEYPKDFKFVGWHPLCRCFSAAKTMSKEEYSKLEDYNLGLTDHKPEINYIKDVPENFTRHIEKNADRINEYKNVPYFIRDNKKYTEKLLS